MNEPFELSLQEKEFYQKIGVPMPNLPPPERFQKLMATRNEWKLYKRKCDFTGKEILSAYDPESQFTVYSNNIWWGDSWDPLSYGREFDFTKTFFEQFHNLQKVVPREGTSVFNSINCDYNGHIRESKNCYLNSLVARCEDVLYSYWVWEDKDIMDCMFTNKSTLCYECIDVNNCYNCIALQESNNCHDCYFSYQLKNCDHCIFSSNLINKSYYIFNKPCTKDEFESFKNKIFDGSQKTFAENYQQFLNLKSQAVHRNLQIFNSENCEGEHIYSSKNCINCFDTFESEDCENAISAANSKNIYNCYSAGWPRSELIHYSCVSRGSTNLAFCTYTWFSNNLRYCDSCVSCEDCFGCIGLRRKKYCILNKQYTKEEYEKLVPKIIKHMQKTGEFSEFFPPNLSPFAYNESAAQDFFPLTKEEALKLGWHWKEQEKKHHIPATVEQLPDINNESIIKEILVCKKCKKNYRIIEKEFDFYQKFGLPIPIECYECRHKRRLKMRRNYSLSKDKCDKCNKQINITYSENRPQTIYCEKCYLETVY